MKNNKARKILGLLESIYSLDMVRSLGYDTGTTRYGYNLAYQDTENNNFFGYEIEDMTKDSESPEIDGVEKQTFLRYNTASPRDNYDTKSINTDKNYLPDSDYPSIIRAEVLVAIGNVEDVTNSTIGVEKVDVVQQQSDKTSDTFEVTVTFSSDIEEDILKLISYSIVDTVTQIDSGAISVEQVETEPKNDYKFKVVVTR